MDLRRLILAIALIPAAPTAQERNGRQMLDSARQIRDSGESSYETLSSFAPPARRSRLEAMAGAPAGPM